MDCLDAFSGFQRDIVRNQREHLVLLLANAAGDGESPRPEGFGSWGNLFFEVLWRKEWLHVRKLTGLRAGGKKSDESDFLTLDSIRRMLIQLEDTIIFNLLERSQFSYNPATYDRNTSGIAGFNGSLIEVVSCDMLTGIIFSGSASCCCFHQVNKQIWDVYFDDLLPRLVSKGSDGNCGSSACCDTIILQALSKRIHYGKFVAEAKFWESPDKYSADEDKLMEMLTYKEVEENVMRCVRFKALTFGRVVVTDASPLADLPPKMKPDLVVELYDKWHQGSGSALPPEEAGLGLSFAYLSQAIISYCNPQVVSVSSAVSGKRCSCNLKGGSRELKVAINVNIKLDTQFWRSKEGQSPRACPKSLTFLLQISPAPPPPHLPDATSAPPGCRLHISLLPGHHLRTARLPPLHLPAIWPPPPPAVLQGYLWEADKIRFLEAWIDVGKPTRH
ncbi:hypothetical protein GUJ93_ZPchr0009g1351 [Zizania palustris]|uniref:Chorismate mutase n=1 Tax=Zizania palustris TaxID=103762 RepID=A0A8J5RE89_ZIZPA|nr:hypothetical protein GUJ93_ZPchr0009g1351 [Zizania palustris]